MTNKNVIEIIDRVMDPNVDQVSFNANEVFCLIAHGYYYVRPGKDTDRFIKQINKILAQARKSRRNTHEQEIGGIPFEDWLIGKMSADAISIARTMFDKEYYDSQIAKMVMWEEYDESLLERYIHCLNDDELKSVFEGLVTFKLQYDAFISDENFELMETEIEEKCVDIVQSSYCYAANYDMHMDCIYNTPDGFFMYLCKESIIDTICRYVDEDPLMFACLIKAFKYSNPHTAAEYTGLAMCLDYEFELDIFDPPITDMSKRCLEDHDPKDSTVIYKNKGGNLMIA